MVQHHKFNILSVSASLNNNKEVVGESDDTDPTMLCNLTSAWLNRTEYFIEYGFIESSQSKSYYVCPHVAKFNVE